MSGVVEVISGVVDTWSNILSWVQEVITWVVNWWLFNSDTTLLSPSTFWNFLLWVLKNLWLWFLHHWYWFVGFIVCYVLFIFLYHFIWDKVVLYYQKKWYEKFRSTFWKC